MLDSKIVKRYNAYYQGWCLAFGEHTADYGEDRDISWLFGEEKVGMIFSPKLLKRAQREFLGNPEKIPQFAMSDGSLRLNNFTYLLPDEIDKHNVKRLKDFLLNSHELHMFLSSHLIYPPRTRIITFARKKPIIIMYKEMQPLELVVE